MNRIGNELEIHLVRGKIREEDFNLKSCYDISIANYHLLNESWEGEDGYYQKAEKIKKFIKEKKEQRILVPRRDNKAVRSCKKFHDITSLMNYNVSLGNSVKGRMNGNKLNYAFVFNLISRKDLTPDLNDLDVPYVINQINDSRKIKLSVFQIEDLKEVC